MSDPSRIPARVPRLLASVTGHRLSLHAAAAAAGSVALDPEGWSRSTAGVACQAGLTAARSALSFAPTEMVRQIRTFVFERRESAVVVYGAAMAVAC